MVTSAYRIIALFALFALFSCHLNACFAAAMAELDARSRAIAHARNDVTIANSTTVATILGVEVTTSSIEDVRAPRMTYIAPSTRQELDESRQEDIYISVDPPEILAEGFAEGQIGSTASAASLSSSLASMATSTLPPTSSNINVEAFLAPAFAMHDAEALVIPTSSQDTRVTTIIRKRDDGATYAIDTRSLLTTAAFLTPVSAHADKTVTIFVPTPMTPSNVSITLPLVIAGESTSGGISSITLPPPALSDLSTSPSTSPITASFLTTIQLTKTEVFQTAVVLSTVLTEESSPTSGVPGSILNVSAPAASSNKPSHTSTISSASSSKSSASATDVTRTDTATGSRSGTTTGATSVSESTTSGSPADSTLSRVTAPVTTAPPAPTSGAGNGYHVRRDMIREWKAYSSIRQWMHVILVVAISWIPSLL